MVAVFCLSLGLYRLSPYYRTLQQAKAIFSQIRSGPELSPEEAQVFRTLHAAPTEVRAMVFGLAFKHPSNAAVALPRLEFLLQAVCANSPNAVAPERLWDTVVVRRLKKKKLPQEILLLAAGTADIFRLDAARQGGVTRLLLNRLAVEANTSTRVAMTGILLSGADRLPQSDIPAAASLLLGAMEESTNSVMHLSLPAAWQAFRHTSRRLRPKAQPCAFCNCRADVVFSRATTPCWARSRDELKRIPG